MGFAVKWWKFLDNNKWLKLELTRNEHEMKQRTENTDVQGH